MSKKPPKPSYQALEQRVSELEEQAAERIEAHKALQESEERFRLMIETATQMIVLCDPDWKIQYINRAGLTLGGYDEEEVLGHKPVDFMDPQEFERVIDLKDRFSQLSGDSVKTCETAFIHRKGHMVPVEASAAPTVKEGAVTGFLFTARDISERRQMEEELLRAKKLESIGFLAGGIAHDYNNLLTAMMGYITLAESVLEPDNEALAHLVRARHAANMAKNLSRKLITFSRGGSPMKKRAPVPPLLENTISFALAGSNIECEFLVPPHLWPVEYDDSQMSQAIHNIVINARESMPGGGSIRVEAENMHIRGQTGHPVDPGDWVRITIEDEGYGISTQNLDRIFDPYFSTKEMGAQKGQGLGLAISHSIIRNHQGYLFAESEPDRGTALHIYLPASNPARGREADHFTLPRKGAPARILVMDDEEIVRDITCEMLDQAGYEVGLARDGPEAIRMFTEHMEQGKPYQVAVLDLTVRGGMGGKEVVGKLLEIEPGLKAVVSSGYSEDPVMTDFSSYGFSASVTKPYSMNELRGAIEKLLKGNTPVTSEPAEAYLPKKSRQNRQA